MENKYTGRPSRSFSSRMGNSNGTDISDSIVHGLRRLKKPSRFDESKFVNDYLKLSVEDLFCNISQGHLFRDTPFTGLREPNVIRTIILDKVFDLLFSYKIKTELVLDIFVKHHLRLRFFIKDFSSITEDQNSFLLNTIANKLFIEDAMDLNNNVISSIWRIRDSKI